jgi:CheY-like chemotaxis protein/CRP-like cAMP-binding protein
MKKILVIEDENEVRDNIAEILQLSDYEVLKAPDGISGVDMATAGMPDLILCDITMPGLDGYEVLHALHQHPATADVPFVFLTASTEKEQIRKAMTAGADDYLTKPFEGIELLRAVETCLRKRQLREAANASRKIAAAPGQGTSTIFQVLRLTPEQRDMQTFRKRQMIYLEGQRPAFIYYLLSGKIKVYRMHSDGKEFISTIAGPGDFLGYAALLQDCNYQDNAQVLEDAGMLLISRQEFIETMSIGRSIAQHFIELLARDVKAQEENLMNLAYNSLRKRVANGLLQLTDRFPEKNGKEACIGISRDNLSHFIGSATESLTRTLSDFRNEKLIDIRDGKIYLLNKEKLGNLAN